MVSVSLCGLVLYYLPQPKEWPLWCHMGSVSHCGLVLYYLPLPKEWPLWYHMVSVSHCGLVLYYLPQPKEWPLWCHMVSVSHCGLVLYYLPQPKEWPLALLMLGMEYPGFGINTRPADALAPKVARASAGIARARPAVPLGLWSITSSLRGNLYVPRLHKFIKWFADNDVAHRN